MYNTLVDIGSWRYKRHGDAAAVDSLALFGLKQASLYEVGHRLDKELNKNRCKSQNQQKLKHAGVSAVVTARQCSFTLYHLNVLPCSSSGAAFQQLGVG